jgi:8-oxo-dGTP pyrophosphatase MutT (NUDIX family)
MKGSSPPQRFTVPVAVHIFLVRDGQILLLRRAHTGYEDGNYSVPAGHLDGGELVLQAAAREAREETGITLEPETMSIAGVMHRRSNDERIDFFVAAKGWSGHIHNAEPQKCAALSWFPLHALPSNTIPYIRRAIANYRQQGWFASFGWSA